MSADGGTGRTHNRSGAYKGAAPAVCMEARREMYPPLVRLTTRDMVGTLVEDVVWREKDEKDENQLQSKKKAAKRAKREAVA